MIGVFTIESEFAMNCPKCGSADCTKDGIFKGKQRHKCKSCGYRQQRGIDPATKRDALQLYLEGLGFRSIGRFLKCSHVAVYNWIRAHGESIEVIRSAAGVEVVEMDEGSSTAKWAPATPARGGSVGIQSKTTA